MDTPHEATTVEPDAAALSPADIERLFPPDPDLMMSPEGDSKGLREVQDAARRRGAELATPQ